MDSLDDSALANAKRQLKPTTTLVTRADGFQYTETVSYTDTKNQRSHTNKLNLKITPPTHGYVVDERPDLQIGFVTKQLLIGSLDAASDKELLLTHRVTHILSVAPMQHYKPPITVEHFRLDILDLPDTDLSQYYTDAFAFIDKAIESNGHVLVHCNAGVSRSAAITIAYLMKTKHLSYDMASDIVKEKRPAINPNLGFILQLKNYEEMLFVESK